MKIKNYKFPKLNLLLFAFIISSLALFTSCSSGGGDNPTPPGSTDPSIRSISPTKGAVGTSVTINGKNFSATKSDNAVTFGNTAATIQSATDTELSVTVPDGLTAGSNYSVTATVDGKSATAPNKFAVSAPPAIADAVMADDTLETVTWNLKNYKTSSDDQKTNNDIQIIDSLNADLFAFEEVDSKKALDKIVNRMKGYHEVYEKNPYEGNAFVYNTNAIDSVSSGKITMGQDSHDWAGRLPYYFSFHYKPVSGKQPITIYAVVIHAKAQTGGADDYNRRVKASQELYDYLTKQKQNARIILLGDYNDEPTTSIYKDKESPYHNFAHDSTRYRVLTYPLASQNNVSSEPNFPSSVIDNITISNEMVKYYIDGSTSIFIPDENFIPNYGSTTSDHYPVEAKFDMRR